MLVGPVVGLSYCQNSSTPWYDEANQMFDRKKRSVYRRTIGVQCVRRITTLGAEEALAYILNSDLNHDVLLLPREETN